MDRIPIKLPEGFVRRMQSQLGEEFPAFMHAVSGDAPVGIRLNPAKIDYPPFPQNQPVPWNSWGYFLDNRPVFALDPRWHGGAYYVQEPSSMLLAAMIPQTSSVKVLDVCAAPGGKSTLLASMIDANSILVSNEVVPSRARVLLENMIKWGAPNVIVTQNEPGDWQQMPDYFDLILVDAPCSGEGMFRKDPFACEQWNEGLVNTCAIRQEQILEAVLPALKPGGHLIYATCTYAPEENALLLGKLLDKMKGASASLSVDPVSGLQKYGATPVAIGGEAQGGWQCYPHKMRGEGLFLARLTKRGRVLGGEAPPKSRKESRKKPVRPQKEIHSFLETYLAPDFVSYFDPEIFKDTLRLVPPYGRDFKGKHFHFLQLGILAGKQRKQVITPSHPLAMMAHLQRALPTWPLDEEGALNYLRREMIAPPSKPERKGWKLMTYAGVALGWGKWLGNGWKNHYPIPWRLMLPRAGLPLEEEK